MLIDELRQSLKSAEADIAAIKAFWLNSNVAGKFATLDTHVNDPEFWKNPDRDSIITEHRALKHIVESYPTITKSYTDFLEIIELFSDNESELEAVKNDIAKIGRAHV